MYAGTKYICLAGTWLTIKRTGCLPEVDSGSVCVWEVSESKVAQVYKYTQCQPYIAIIMERCGAVVKRRIQDR